MTTHRNTRTRLVCERAPLTHFSDTFRVVGVVVDVVGGAGARANDILPPTSQHTHDNTPHTYIICIVFSHKTPGIHTYARKRAREDEKKNGHICAYIWAARARVARTHLLTHTRTRKYRAVSTRAMRPRFLTTLRPDLARGFRRARAHNSLT